PRRPPKASSTAGYRCGRNPGRGIGGPGGLNAAGPLTRGPREIADFVGCETRGPREIADFVGWETRGPREIADFVGWEMARGKGPPRSWDTTGRIRGPTKPAPWGGSGAPTKPASWGG